MKILILSNGDSVHTYKWVTALCARNIDIILFSLNEFNPAPYNGLKNFKSFALGFNSKLSTVDNKFKKLLFLFFVGRIKRIIAREKPDILHAHYATSYGLMGALCNFHPYIISVWGSDIFHFPGKSFFHRKFIEYNLSKADMLLSTSHVMAEKTQKYTDKDIEVTPFGIDTSVFKPFKTNSLFDDDAVVIGTIKNLASKYGIDYLIKAFKIISDKYPGLKLNLLIVGGGSKARMAFLKNLCKEMQIDQKVKFTGLISHADVPAYNNMLDIYVAVSILDSESFGVAIIEASACEKPVIVSNVGGLPEVVKNEETGFIVSPKNEYETADAIEKLVLNNELKLKMGKNGRKFVQENYEWDFCVDKMISVYNKIISPISSGS
jgi:L-malate glycosyltransferase